MGDVNNNGGLDAALGLGPGDLDAVSTPNSLGVLGTFGVTDNQVSDQQLFTA